MGDIYKSEERGAGRTISSYFNECNYTDSCAPNCESDKTVDRLLCCSFAIVHFAEAQVSKPTLELINKQKP